MIKGYAKPMADLVKIRAAVFIGGVHWLPPVQDPETGIISEYAGDAREFTPHAAHTGRSRAEQEVVVDFVKRKLFAYADTGITTLKQHSPDGRTAQFEQGKANTEGIAVVDERWEAMAVTFAMKACAPNPLRAEDPTIDYLLHITVSGEDGSVAIKGSHDGFPCYEVYKQVDYGDFELLYKHDFRVTGDAPAEMAGEMASEMKYHFERKL